MGVKTLQEIIEEVKSGGQPEYDELRYSLLVLDAITTFDLLNLHAAIRAPKLLTLDWLLEENIKRMQIALKSIPKEYVGKNNDPDSEEYQVRRQISSKIVDRVLSRRNP